MKFGLTLGYWGAAPPQQLAETAKAAEDHGFDAVWSAESWGSDAFSPLVWIAAHTDRIRLGTGIVQLAARTPTATAMHAMTLDHLSNGRLILGLGVSGPQVVEGWYGQPSNRPLARTREYVSILRAAFAREEHLQFEGDYYSHPYNGPGSVGLGKPLKIMTHPLRAHVPIWIGAEGPKNVAQTAAIADGWLPLYYSPWRQEVYADSLTDAPNDFEVAVNVSLNICDDVSAGLGVIRATLAFYVGGMGAEGQNYHTALMSRMGEPEAAEKIQDLFMRGDRDAAIAAVPEDFADEISLVGPPDRIRKKLDAWESSPVTMLNVAPRGPEQVAEFAQVLMG